MTGLEIMAVVGAVAAVVSAYNDGSELVKKVRERRRTKKALENATFLDTSTQDLEWSLDTGQDVVQRKYDSHYRRLGQTFANGDQEAINTLKDIIIHLQGQVISNLKIAWREEDTMIDFLPLQDVSDDSQDRTILCLMQLHQRLLVAAPITEMRNVPPHTPPTAFHGFVEPASRQSSFATQSTIAAPSLMSPLRSSTNTTEVEIRRPSRFPFRKQKTIVEAAQPRILNASSIIPEGFPPTTPPKDYLADDLLIRGLGLGTSPPDRLPLNVSRMSSVSTGSTYSDEPEHPESNPFFDPWKDTSRPLPSRRKSQSYLHRLSLGPDTIPEHTSALGHRTSEPSSHPCIPSSMRPSSAGKRNSQASDNSLQLSSTPSVDSTRRPSQSLRPPPTEPPIAQQVIQPRTTGGLRGYLPTEENDFAGFCNGAWKLQIGERKKAFEAISRPGSMYNKTSFWKCKKCYFEGRMTKDARGQRCIDKRIYGSNGILYRWEFLFKSHVQLEDALPTMDSTFGCIFCCVEGKGTPIFGGVNNFLAHMQEHRARPPMGEVLYRMSCVVGRAPGAEEEFDIALPPV
ncbi:hypothetical protein MMC13_001343 [Lambiella insularis]|nr:hypothetical protein [Lambiella insularis]